MTQLCVCIVRQAHCWRSSWKETNKHDVIIIKFLFKQAVCLCLCPWAVLVLLLCVVDMFTLFFYVVLYLFIIIKIQMPPVHTVIYCSSLLAINLFVLFISHPIISRSLSSWTSAALRPFLQADRLRHPPAQLRRSCHFSSSTFRKETLLRCKLSRKRMRQRMC